MKSGYLEGSIIFITKKDGTYSKIEVPYNSERHWSSIAAEEIDKIGRQHILRVERLDLTPKDISSMFNLKLL